jgi:plasmid stabilization system protein ParE
MTFRVETTADFERESRLILDWLISEHAGDAALRWYETLRQEIESLATMPRRCPLAPENALSPFEVRHFLYARRPNIYRVLFSIEQDTVYVLHIRHGRRLPLI